MGAILIIGLVIAVLAAAGKWSLWQHPADNDPTSARNRWPFN